MKMTYKNLSSGELKQSLKFLLPEMNEFEVELSLEGNTPVTLYTGAEVMSLNNILELVEKQGFKVNDINAITSNGELKSCVGITLNKPFIHDKTKEVIEGLFILGNAHDEKFKDGLYSFLICGEKNFPNCSKTINFSVDIVSENIETAKASFFEKMDSFKRSPNGEGIKFHPLTYDDGEWIELEPEEDDDEIRFQIEDLTLEKINELFEGIMKEDSIVESNEIIEQINEKIFTCPHCKKQLFQKNNTHLSPQETEYKHMIQGVYAFNDGDRVPVDLSRFVENEDMQLDNILMVGKCGFCSGEYYSLEIYIASRPVIVDPSEPFVFCNLQRDKGKQNLFKVEDNHLLIKYEDCSFVEDKISEFLIIHHHSVGLLPLYKSISSDIGVTPHYGGEIWDEASDIILSIMENYSSLVIQ